jgi:hypothetical protein
MARKRTIDHSAVVQHAQQHPEATSHDMARVFGIDRGVVSRILRQAGVNTRGRGIGALRTVKKPPKGTPAEVSYFYWDRLLQRLGLGVCRGEKLGRQRLLLGYDPQRQALQDESATLREEEDDFDPALVPLTSEPDMLLDAAAC